MGNSTSCDTISLEIKLNFPFNESTLLHSSIFCLAHSQPLPFRGAWQMVSAHGSWSSLHLALPSSSAMRARLSSFIRLSPVLVACISLLSAQTHTGRHCPAGWTFIRPPSLNCPLEPRPCVLPLSHSPIHSKKRSHKHFLCCHCGLWCPPYLGASRTHSVASVPSLAVMFGFLGKVLRSA